MKAVTIAPSRSVQEKRAGLFPRAWAGCVLFILFFLCSIGAKAETVKDWELSGGVGAQSSYVYDNAKVVNDGWVVQPWAKALHVPSGLYGMVWSSVGLENSKGNEIDFTAGFETTAHGVKFDLSYNFYEFLALKQGMHAPKLRVCFEEFSLCGKVLYLIPDTGAPSGILAGVWWMHSWTDYKIGTLAGVTYTGGVNGRKPVTVLKGEISVPIAKTGLEIFARGYVPIAGGQADDKSVQGIVGIRFAF